VFAIDPHVPNLLFFPKQLQLKGFAPFEDGRLIAQDKASCLPAYVLLGGLADTLQTDLEVVDATAAPGNKTTHLSALLSTSGRITALERDKFRFRTLQKMVSQAGCKNVKTIKTDFLSIPPDDEAYSKVSHILLDPSCCENPLPSSTTIITDPVSYLFLV